MLFVKKYNIRIFLIKNVISQVKHLILILILGFLKHQMGALTGSKKNLRCTKPFKLIKNQRILANCNKKLSMRPRPLFHPRLVPPGVRPLPPPPNLRPPLLRGNRLPPPPPIHLGSNVRGPLPRLGTRPFSQSMRPPPGMRPPPPPPPLPHHMMRSMMPMPGPRDSRGNFFRPIPPQLIQQKMRKVTMNKGQFIKKKRSLVKSLDLTKPWVTESIRAEFNKRDELLRTAKSTQKQEDWASYREQREKCTNFYNSAKTKFNGGYPEEVRIPQLMPSNLQTPVLTAPIDYTADVIL